MTKPWLRTAMLVGLFYLAIGLTGWRVPAFVISAVVFTAHIAYEHVRRRTSPRVTAWHASVAVAFGGFALALAANIHDIGSPTGYRPKLLIALVAWPLLTAVPAFLVALVMAIVLGTQRAETHP